MSEQSNVRPLYVYLSEDLHDFLDSIKEEFSITKSDSVYLILSYVKKYWPKETIDTLYQQMTLLGEEGIQKVA